MASGASNRPQNYSPALVDRVCSIWESYDNLPKAMFNLLKGDYLLVISWDPYGTWSVVQEA